MINDGPNPRFTHGGFGPCNPSFRLPAVNDIILRTLCDGWILRVALLRFMTPLPLIHLLHAEASGKTIF
jgi:hypothetical protein